MNVTVPVVDALSPAWSVTVAVSAFAPGVSLMVVDHVPSAFGVTGMPLTRTDRAPPGVAVAPLTV